MTGDRERVTVEIEVNCDDCSTDEAAEIMKLDDDVEGGPCAHYTCPKCKRQISIRFSIRN